MERVDRAIEVTHAENNIGSAATLSIPVPIGGEWLLTVFHRSDRTAPETVYYEATVTPGPHVVDMSGADRIIRYSLAPCWLTVAEPWISMAVPTRPDR